MTDTFTGETYSALCADAEGYLASGAPEQARELLLKAISLIGTRTRARSLLADTCMSMELWPEAREQLEILITLEEGNTRNNFRLGQVLEELGEYQLAADNYTVVLQEDSRHHGALVALKRIVARNSESGVSLADIFTVAGSGTDERSGGPEVAPGNDGARIEGLQFFPDLQTDAVFADAEGPEASLTLDRLLDTMGVRSTPDGWKAEDVSKLLDDMTGPQPDSFQSLFAGEPSPEGEDAPAPAPPEHFATKPTDLASIFAGGSPLPDAAVEAVGRAPSLEEIFGASMKPAAPEPVVEEPAIPEPVVEEPAIPEPVVEEPAIPEPVEEPVIPEPVEEPVIPEPVVEEPAIPEPVVEEPAIPEPVVGEPATPEAELAEPSVAEPQPETPEAGTILFAAGPDPSVFSSMDALEAIFSAAAASTVIPVRTEPRSADGPGAPGVVGPETPPVEPVEPADPGCEPVEAPLPETCTGVETAESEPIGLEVVFGAEPEPPVVEVVPAISEEPVPVQPGTGEIPEPVPSEAAEPGSPPEAPVDYYTEPWSQETGLVSVTLFSGVLSVRTELLAAFESSLVCEPGPDGICPVHGEGTMMLNCGPAAPLVLEAEEGMLVSIPRLALLPPAGEFHRLEIDGLARLAPAGGTRLLFQTDHPVRNVVLEGGTTALLVRSGSLVAASPGVAISEESALAGYLTATGQGRLYLIE